MKKGNPLPHLLVAGHRFRLMLSGAYQPTGRIVRIDRKNDLFWFRLDESKDRLDGPWCFSHFAGPLQKWKVFIVHYPPMRTYPLVRHMMKDGKALCNGSAHQFETYESHFPILRPETFTTQIRDDVEITYVDMTDTVKRASTKTKFFHVEGYRSWFVIEARNKRVATQFAVKELGRGRVKKVREATKDDCKSYVELCNNKDAIEKVF